MNLRKICGYALAITFTLALGFALAVNAKAEAETPSDAQALVEKAVDYYKTNGSAAAFKAFVDDPQFKSGSLYVYVLDKNGVMLVHGAQNALVGKDFSTVADVTGNYFGKEIIKTEDTNWVEYYWTDEVTQKVEKKKVFVTRYNDMFFCVGVYVEE